MHLREVERLLSSRSAGRAKSHSYTAAPTHAFI
jgi:hypothetical protein